MTIKARARRDEDKEARRRAILDAALRILETTPFAKLTMADVAADAGIVKGTLYLYFRTKEHLFLAVLEEQLGAWFDDAEARLATERGQWDADRVATALCASLMSRPTLTRLLALLEGVLEHNVDYDTVVAFKLALGARVGQLGKRVEQRLGWTRAGSGTRALLHARALLAGLWQMADMSPHVRRAMDEQPRVRALRVEFEREARKGVAALLRGFERTQS